MNEKHIRIARGETRKWNCTVTTDGLAQSLTGCSISFTVKSSYSHTDGQAIFKLSIGTGISISNTTAGQYVLTVSTLCTSTVVRSQNNTVWYFDHRIKLSDGSVKQLESGDFVITPGITDTVV